MSRTCSPLRTRLPIVLATATLVACSSQGLDGGSRQSFFVRNALAPPVDRPNNICVYSNSPDAPALARGKFDVGLATSYQLTLSVAGSDPTLTTSVTAAHVVLRHEDMVLSQTDVIANAAIAPGGIAVVTFQAIDPSAADVLVSLLPTRSARVSLVAEVDLQGRDPASGASTSAAPFQFPIDACRGCLLDFSQGDDPTGTLQPNCRIPAASDLRRPCLEGQDEAVDCRLCVGRNLLCDPSTE
jgi:hypothetical protein